MSRPSASRLRLGLAAFLMATVSACAHVREPVTEQAAGARAAEAVTGPGDSTQSPLTVETVEVSSQGETCSFNDGRAYVISIHKGLEDGDLATQLDEALAAAGLAGDVVVDWFGSDPPDRVELVLGRDLPIPLASALVTLTRAHTSAPLVVSGSEDQPTLCNSARAYVGSLLPTINAVTSTQTLDLLSRDDVSPEEFWAAVPSAVR